MITNDFFKYQAQTSPYAWGFEPSHAKGNWIYDVQQNAYLDFAAGVSATTLGHQHPHIQQTIQNQLNSHLHLMVYGEYAQSAPVKLCRFLAEHLPKPLDTTYLVNSGAEAIELALKLAKRFTGRSKIISAYQAYHGNTHGAMSVNDHELQAKAYGPLLPNIHKINFNRLEDINQIDETTACVILETIQGAAGFIVPHVHYLKAVKQQCEQVGALLILDEIQPGIGRTGRFFAFEHFDMVPDILVMGKGLGGGMPIGAVTTSANIMEVIQTNPMLGHIATFGGHPLVAAAALSTVEALFEEQHMSRMAAYETQFRALLIHRHIHSVRGMGLMLAVELKSADFCLEVAKRCMQKGLIVFWLLYKQNFLRITPPLTLTPEEITHGCQIICSVLDEMD